MEWGERGGSKRADEADEGGRGGAKQITKMKRKNFLK